MKSLSRTPFCSNMNIQRTARLVCQAGNINPSRRRHHRGIGGARSATCAPGGGGGVDWWPRRRRCHAVAPSPSPFFATHHQMSARLVLFRPIISILHCWPFFFLVLYTWNVCTVRRNSPRGWWISNNIAFPRAPRYNMFCVPRMLYVFHVT